MQGPVGRGPNEDGNYPTASVGSRQSDLGRISNECPPFLVSIRHAYALPVTAGLAELIRRHTVFAVVFPAASLIVKVSRSPSNE